MIHAKYYVIGKCQIDTLKIKSTFISDVQHISLRYVEYVHIKNLTFVLKQMYITCDANMTTNVHHISTMNKYHISVGGMCFIFVLRANIVKIWKLYLHHI